LVSKNNLGARTKSAIDKTQKAIIAVRANLRNVVRTRMFVTNIDNWKEIDKASVPFFGKIKLFTTMAGVSRFMGADYLIKIEATALIES
jgi:enamine deaminase RidA (YjgF/YER057c/UK114 family)